MSVYMTEAEQIDALKKWWQRYNGIITVLFSVILLILAGIRYWSWHQEKVTFQASNAYERMMLAFSNQDNKAVRGYARQLVTDYGHTVYADAARLTLAKLYVNHEKYAEAQKELEYVAGHAKMMALADVAKIRLARILTAEKSYEQALNELTKVQENTYLPVVNELRGDIYSATGRYQEAANYYRQAIKEVQTNGMGNLFLEMKTNELAAYMQSMTAKDAKPLIAKS